MRNWLPLCLLLSAHYILNSFCFGNPCKMMKTKMECRRMRYQVHISDCTVCEDKSNPQRLNLHLYLETLTYDPLIYELRHEISNNVVCATSKTSGQSLCLSLEYYTTVKLPNEHHLELPSLKGGCTGSSESTLVKMPHCWKSHVVAHIQ